MTVQQQREKIIVGLAEVKIELKNLCTLVEKQNGSIKTNANEIVKNGKKISWLVGIGVGVSFVLGLGIAFL